MTLFTRMCVSSPRGSNPSRINRARGAAADLGREFLDAHGRTTLPTLAAKPPPPVQIRAAPVRLSAALGEWRTTAAVLRCPGVFLTPRSSAALLALATLL